MKEMKIKFYKRKESLLTTTKKMSETKKNIFEHPPETIDQPTDESLAPEAIGGDEPEHFNPIPTINNETRIKSILDISQIKGYMTNQLKAEHLEKIIQKVKDKLIIIQTMFDFDIPILTLPEPTSRPYTLISDQT